MNMTKRILLSLRGGVVFQVLYYLLLFLIVSVPRLVHIPNPDHAWWIRLMSLPLTWGGDLYSWLSPAQSERVFALLRLPVILSNFVGGFLFFGVVT